MRNRYDSKQISQHSIGLMNGDDIISSQSEVAMTMEFIIF